MDGNGRWAQRRGMPRTAGHSAGSESFRRAAYYLKDLDVKYLTVYAFSTENWKRPPEEVSAIMSLLRKYLLESIEEMCRKNIRLRFLGDLAPLDGGLKRLIERTDELSRQNDGMLVSVCLNYGGRAEIIRAAQALGRRCADGELRPEDVTEEALAAELYSAGAPDPDLVIRPGGEKRISNFLLWQSSYSEFYFTDTLWPDMDERELDKAIAEYQRRNRRFGGVK